MREGVTVMSYYDNIVMQAQMKYSVYYSTYAAGGPPTGCLPGHRCPTRNRSVGS